LICYIVFCLLKIYYTFQNEVINYKGKIEEKEIANILNKLISNNIKFNINVIDKENLGIIFKQLEKQREKISSIHPEIFEKDNDENYHIYFILSLSNLRAENYKISKCNFLKAKEIS